MATSKLICIIGIGNTLRSDDGLGAFVCQKLQKIGWNDVSIYTDHQLQTEWLLDFARHEHVLLIDAVAGRQAPEIREVDTEAGSLSANISHHINIKMLAGTLKTLQGSYTRFYTLAIPGKNFEFGESISDDARAAADSAVVLVRDWVDSIRVRYA